MLDEIEQKNPRLEILLALKRVLKKNEFLLQFIINKGTWKYYITMIVKLLLFN
jgi:hypothetical protein